MTRSFGSVLILTLSTMALSAQESEISFFSELPPSAASVAYLADLRRALAEAGFEIGNDGVPIEVGRGDIPEIVATTAGAIGFVLLQSRIEQGDVGAALLSVPASFTGFEESRRAQQGFIGDRARSEVTQDGMLAIGLWTHGMNAVLSSTRIAELSDLQGLRVNANDPASQAFFANLGAAPVPFAAAEVFNALQVGAFDTAILPQEAIGSDFLSLVGDGTVLTDHSSRIAVTVVGDDWWSGLGAGDQRRFLEALDRAEQGAAVAIAGRFDELASAMMRLGTTATTWAAFSGEALDAAVVAATEEAALAESNVVRLLYRDAQDLLTDIRFGTPRDLPELERVTGDARVFFATDRRYDPQFGPLRDRFANENGTSGTWHCGELRPAEPFERGEVRFAIELVDGSAVTMGADCVEKIAGASAKVGSRILVYVHGYANTFDDAARRGLALARDVPLDIPMVVWSWPSRGPIRNYGRDADAVDWSELQFSRFVEALTAQSEISGVDIMAHSMGTRLAANLMRDDWPGGEAAVVLAAADIARPNLSQSVEEADKATVTLLVSKRDRALWASQLGWTRGPRAGHADPLFVYSGIDTIDLSGFDRMSNSNHGHAFVVPEVLDDLARIFAGEWSAAERRLESKRERGAQIDHYVIPTGPN